MKLPKDPKAKKDLCPCCHFQVSRRTTWPPTRKARLKEAKRIGSKMAKVLLICGHSHNTFQLGIVGQWEEAKEQSSAIQFYCEDKPCKKHRPIVWAWTVAI